MSTVLQKCSRQKGLAAPFVLFTGGKGGVGKTTLAANVALQLSEAGSRTLLVDLDLGLANLNLLLGLTPKHTIADAIQGRVALRECVLRGPAGIDLLPAASGLEEMGRLGDTSRARLVELLRGLAREYSIIVGDSASGIGPDVLAFASLADRVVVVTTPDLTALTDAYGLIKALDHFGARTEMDIPTPEILVNLAKDVNEGKSVANKLGSICARFLARSPRQAGWMPRSARIAEGALCQRPFALSSTRGLEGLCLDQIAGRLRKALCPVERG